MAFITTSQVNEFRLKLKEAFSARDGWKLSVTKEHNSGICVAIMEAPLDFSVCCSNQEKKYSQLNPRYFGEHYAEYPALVEVVEKINSIINLGNYDKSEPMTDYFEVGWYTDVHVGKWDKFFVYVPKQVSAPVQAVTEPVQEIAENEIQVIKYSEKSIAVIGNTISIKDELKNIGGKWNSKLSCGKGWIFPLTKLEDLKQVLTNLKVA